MIFYPVIFVVDGRTYSAIFTKGISAGSGQPAIEVTEIDPADDTIPRKILFVSNEDRTSYTFSGNINEIFAQTLLSHILLICDEEHLPRF